MGTNKGVRATNVMRVLPPHFGRSDSEKSGPEQPQLSFPSSTPSSPSNLSPLDSEREPETSFTSATDIPSARLRKKTAKANSVDSKKMPRSHRDSNSGGPYERLETGFGGPSDGGGSAKRGGRFTWKKMAVVAVVFIGLVWVFGPRVKQHYGYGSTASEYIDGLCTFGGGGRLTYPFFSGTTPHDYDVDPIAGTGTPTKQLATVPTATTGTGTHHADIDDDLAASSPPTTNNNSNSSPQHPTTFDTDPDPSKTTHCTTPPNPSLPLVQYALMIDAGSTGSRIHIYKFNNCGPTPSFEYEVFKMTQPGLSYYAANPADAAGSLDVLLAEAVRVVPAPMRACTPVAVKATAGLRLLPGTQSAEILDAVGRRIKGEYPFRLVDKEGVVIMDGKDEGVYAWITANYLMGTIKEGAGGAGSELATYAVLDLGGASTQIVFEPAFEREKGEMEEGEHKYDLKFAGRSHVLYQHSYLDYGLMRARVHIHRLVEFMNSVRANGKLGGNDVVGNPCLAKGTRRGVQITDEKSEEKRNVTMGGEDVGSFEGCNRLMQLVLAKDASVSFDISLSFHVLTSLQYMRTQAMLVRRRIPAIAA
jgi:guanosine-diphosphatase